MTNDTTNQEISTQGSLHFTPPLLPFPSIEKSNAMSSYLIISLMEEENGI